MFSMTPFYRMFLRTRDTTSLLSINKTLLTYEYGGSCTYNMWCVFQKKIPLHQLYIHNRKYINSAQLSFKNNRSGEAQLLIFIKFTLDCTQRGDAPKLRLQEGSTRSLILHLLKLFQESTLKLIQDIREYCCSRLPKTCLLYLFRDRRDGVISFIQEK